MFSSTSNCSNGEELNGDDFSNFANVEFGLLHSSTLKGLTEWFRASAEALESISTLLHFSQLRIHSSGIVIMVVRFASESAIQQLLSLLSTPPPPTTTTTQWLSSEESASQVVETSHTSSNTLKTSNTSNSPKVLWNGVHLFPISPDLIVTISSFHDEFNDCDHQNDHNHQTLTSSLEEEKYQTTTVEISSPNEMDQQHHNDRSRDICVCNLLCPRWLEPDQELEQQQQQQQQQQQCANPSHLDDAHWKKINVLSTRNVDSICNTHIAETEVTQTTRGTGETRQSVGCVDGVGFLDIEGPQTMVMAILNVTPDSFSDGGDLASRDEAVARGLEAVREGADILDIGGESTRPGSDPVSVEEEQRRVIGVIEGLRETYDGLISIDTMKAEVARAALSAGADLVNDVSGGIFDYPSMFQVCSEFNAPLVLMHKVGSVASNEKVAVDCDIIETTSCHLLHQADKALDHGIPPWHVMLDPGLGFSKSYDQSLTLLQKSETFKQRVHPFPILHGASRKGFIGHFTGVSKPKDRSMGTHATVCLASQTKVGIVRVHEVAPTVEMLRMADLIWRSS